MKSLFAIVLLTMSVSACTTYNTTPPAPQTTQSTTTYTPSHNATTSVTTTH